MHNLIDRDALIASGKMYSSYEIGVVKSAPTVDAVPVVHGRWISKSHGFWEVSECSECGVQYPTVGTGLNYCPNCGARMDLEVE